MEIVEMTDTEQTRSAHPSPFTHPSSPLTDNIWAAAPSLSERMSKMNLSEDPRPWGPPDFVPQTPAPSQAQPSFPHFAPQAQVFVPQHPQQQHVMGEYNHGHRHAQPFAGQHQQFGGQPQQFVGHPQQFVGQPQQFVGQPQSFPGHAQFPMNVPYAQPAASHYASVYGRHQGRSTTFAPPMVQARRLTDPFVDPRDTMQSPQSFNHPAPRAMYSAGGDPAPAPPSTSQPTKQGRSAEHQANAARIAQQIKAGLFEESPDSGPARSRRESYASSYTPRRERRSTGASNSAWTVQQPIIPVAPVARLTLAPPESITQPPWFGALAQGYTPSLTEVLDHVPFIETCKEIKPSELGVVKITNVCVTHWQYTTSRELIYIIDSLWYHQKRDCRCGWP